MYLGDSYGLWETCCMSCMSCCTTSFNPSWPGVRTATGGYELTTREEASYCEWCPPGISIAATFNAFKISNASILFLDFCIYIFVFMHMRRQILQPHHSHERQQRSHRHLQAGLAGLKTVRSSKFQKIMVS